ncbi:hypothetical protein Mal4_53700 [Maioricimonas rarisocia]|uniref:Uncharacterized protein n=1 Tax=Maioricimonas rarisocia TaxID=2528026 RepID=A0A517ZEU0_9PLAN|nr:hypothetical protein [Maioricimonas rarisocia]QDU41005.1 hypothetical protein Mal4_53700 [Maioricimonas rarisocia]
MVVMSANPVVVNRRQVLLSDGVVAVQVLDQRTGRCDVTEQWGDLALSGEQTIDGLSELPPLEESASYLVPVTRAGDSLSITRTHPDGGPALIYPDTPAARAQAQKLLQ